MRRKKYSMILLSRDSIIMKVYLKGYYGYRNIGDEVLLLWVIHYLAQEKNITHITLETDNPDRMSWWIKQHNNFAPIPVSCVNRNRPRRKKISEAVRSLCGLFPMIVLWWGEVINDRHARPRNGRQYLMQYPGMIFGIQKYMILGGITVDPKSPWRHIRTLLHHAKLVILRDQTSYDIAHQISPQNTELYHDRAYDALDQIDIPKTTYQTSNYVLLNYHLHLIDDEKMLKKCKKWIESQVDKIIYFVPGDLNQDQKAYQTLQKTYPHIQRRDRSTRSLSETLDFFAKADTVAGSRLHLLLLFQAVGHTPAVFSYHPKIQKVLGLS